MIGSREESPLYPIANPESVAFFGASNSMASMGGNLLQSMQAIGFRGPMYPIHAREKTVHGLQAYASLTETPTVPELAVLVVPAHAVAQILEACGQRGVRRAIVISGGFKEAGPQGTLLEKEILAVANAYGIRFLGPNCIGVANMHRRVNTTFVEHEGKPGFIGMASQSGSFITQMFHYLNQFHLGFSTAFSVGNEADIDLAECMAYLALCPDTRVIALYVEGIRDGRRFMETAQAIVPRKPVVALYVGGSEAGRKAALSHTGSMAGSDALYQGMFQQCGILRASSLEELFDLCWVLGTCPIPKGDAVLIQTHSGGPGAAAADACSRQGLRVPGLSEDTRERLAPLVPHTASIENPVDLTFSKNQLDYFGPIPEVLLEDKGTHSLLFYYFTPPQIVRRALQTMGVPPEAWEGQIEELIEGQCRALASLEGGKDKPLVAYTYRAWTDFGVQALMAAGVPVFPGAERAACALRGLVAYGRVRERFFA